MLTQLLEHADSMIQQIKLHPFNVELIAGQLPKEKFTYYIAQDALYLTDYARALALVAAKLPDALHMKQFLEFAMQAIHAEQDLHRRVLQSFVASKQRTPNANCFMYTNYLLKTACLGSPAEAVASLLPCFWIYREMGHLAVTQTQENNPYQEWIALYASEDFSVSVDAAILITNELALMAAEAEREKMQRAFLYACKLEYLFWDAAYHLADPV